MGIGHQKTKQASFINFNWKHQLSHGGELRKKQLGRKQRPLSTKEPIHVVFKVHKLRLRHKSLRTSKNFQISYKIIGKYSKYFSVKVEQFSIQPDHIHLLVRSSRRKNLHHFFRVVAGQIAQSLEKVKLLTDVTDTPLAPNGLWKYRPFSRVVRGWKAYNTVRNYIQLNEKEATGEIRYQKKRLRGLSNADWQILWS